jgi:hypothetical protein
MPLLRRDDPARRVGTSSLPNGGEDRRPVPPRDAQPHNGRPLARKPYTYRGSGKDELTPWMDGDPASVVAPMRALSRAALLDVCEAIEGPGPEWYRERSLERDA